MQLPYTDQIEIQYLNRLFDNTSECYKFFWFQEILNKVLEGKEIITYEGDNHMTNNSYPSIDMKQTGIQLKARIQQAGYSVKDIQEQLNLSCPQPIYRWFNGKVLPSVDHLYVLSRLLKVHMEELLVSTSVPTDLGTILADIDGLTLREQRILLYYKLINQAA